MTVNQPDFDKTTVIRRKMTVVYPHFCGKPSKSRKSPRFPQILASEASKVVKFATRPFWVIFASLERLLDCPLAEYFLPFGKMECEFFDH
jgi:hypothetical protein